MRNNVSAQSDYAEKILAGLIITIRSMPISYSDEAKEKEKIIENLKLQYEKKVRNDPIDELHMNNIIHGAKAFIRAHREEIKD